MAKETQRPHFWEVRKNFKAAKHASVYEQNAGILPLFATFTAAAAAEGAGVVAWAATHVAQTQSPNWLALGIGLVTAFVADFALGAAASENATGLANRLSWYDYGQQVRREQAAKKQSV